VMFSKFERPVMVDGVLRCPVADALTPKFKIHYEPSKDFESMIAVDVPLYTVLRVPVTIGHVAKRYQTPLPEGVDPNALLEPATFNAQPTEPEEEDDDEATRPTPPKKAKKKKSFAAHLTELLTAGVLSSAARSQDAIDELGDRGTEATSAALAPLLAPVRALLSEIGERSDLDNAQKFQMAAARLPEVFGEMDAPDFEKLIRRNLFIARLEGQRSAIRKKDA
jgi:phage gp29-like protein